MSRETQERTIRHPSHPPHTLYLLPTPAYSSGKFICNACSSIGIGFSYHCPTCSFDLHTTCATLPLSVAHYQHPHPLMLTFLPPYENRWFVCNVCGNFGENHWLYRCATCQFNVHLGCAPPAMVADGAASSGQPMFVNQLAMGSAPAGNSVYNAMGSAPAGYNAMCSALAGYSVYNAMGSAHAGYNAMGSAPAGYSVYNAMGSAHAGYNAMGSAPAGYSVYNAMGSAPAGYNAMGIPPAGYSMYNAMGSAPAGYNAMGSVPAAYSVYNAMGSVPAGYNAMGSTPAGNSVFNVMGNAIVGGLMNQATQAIVHGIFQDGDVVGGIISGFSNMFG